MRAKLLKTPTTPVSKTNENKNNIKSIRESYQKQIDQAKRIHEDILSYKPVILLTILIQSHQQQYQY